MSYTVAICLGEMPVDDDAAWTEANLRADSIRIDEPAAPAFRKLHDQLTRQFPCGSTLPDDRVDESVWSGGPLIRDFGQDTAVLGVVFRAVDQVLPVLIAAANSHAMTVFDWQTETIHRPGDLVLTVEGEREIRNPTREQVDAAIGRLTPNGGPGFAILESMQGYVQTAAGDGVYAVEWRENENHGFRHFVAGRDGDNTTDVDIRANGLHLTVKENECLQGSDVMLLFRRFLSDGDRPEGFTWRDISSQFP